MWRLGNIVKFIQSFLVLPPAQSGFFSTKKFATRLTGMLIICFGMLAVAGMLPGYAFRFGNIFFGDVPVLYNTTFAKAAFTIATHPILPWQKPPMFAHYQFSRLKFILGDHYGALEEANKELAIFPMNMKTYYIIGLTYGYMGRAHEGISAFSTYVDAFPETWAGRNDKAWLQFRIGDYDGAMETIEPIVSQFPKTPWVQNTYCTLLINVGRHDDARSVCENAKSIIDRMSPADWGYAYPGNDPRVYESGLDAMKNSIARNLELLDEKTQ